MTDVHNKVVRSFNMSQIKGTNTKPEIILRKYLHAKGFRFRLHVKTLPGKPDIVLPKYKTIILVHGCFWHLHENCKLNRPPKSNNEFWQTKLSNNVKRDKANMEYYLKLGWKVIVVWECELITQKMQALTFERVIKTLLE